MKDRNPETLLYTLSALLVLGGVAVRMLALSENQLGLHLILTGLLTIVAAMLLHMKRINEVEQKNSTADEKQLQNH